jgi:hypothetical protein
LFENFPAIWYILWPFCGDLVFFQFGTFYQEKIWQPCRTILLQHFSFDVLLSVEALLQHHFVGGNGAEQGFGIEIGVGGERGGRVRKEVELLDEGREELGSIL